MRGLAVGVLLLGVCVFLRLRYVRVTVLGASMAPTLTQGDRVLMVRRAVRPGDRGAVVLLTAPPDATREPGLGEWRIKRLVALAGDPVPDAIRAARDLPADAVVPAGEVMVVGDNHCSEDSRRWARLPARLVVAVARNSPAPVAQARR
jgi:signal peptidase I